MPLLSDGRPSAEKGKEEDEIKEKTLIGLRALLRDGVSEAQVAKQQEASQNLVKAEVLKMRANRCFLERLDNGLRHGVGIGISHFHVAEEIRLGPLPRGHKRVFEEDATSGTSWPKRRCYIESETGARRLEMPRLYLDEVIQRPCMRIVSDLGPVGLPASLWLVHGYKVRGTFTWDLLHRLHCCSLGATSDRGLAITRLEMLQALKLRHSPFKQAANHSMLKGAAEELFDLLDSSCPLLEALYEQICDDLGETGPEVGTPAHVERVWGLAKAVLTTMGKGTASKSSRWWSFESASRSFFPDLHMTLMVLMYVGYKRKWFTLEACPIFSDEVTFAQDDLQGIPGADGGQGHAAAEGEAAESDDAASGAGPSTSRISMHAGRAEVCKRRSSCVSSLQFSTRTFSKGLNVRLWKLLVHSVAPLESWFNRHVSSLKTREGARYMHAMLADGALGEVALSVISQANSCDLRDLLDLSPGISEKTDYQMKQDCGGQLFLEVSARLGWSTRSAVAAVQHAPPGVHEADMQGEGEGLPYRPG